MHTAGADGGRGAEDLGTMVEDLIKLLEARVAPGLRRGKYPDRETGRRVAQILRAVATLARGMEIPILAEGVETEEQREALLQEGCAMMQGWLFGHAVPAGLLAAR